MDATGRCPCGASTVRLKGIAAAMTECWCSDCQKETGGSCTHTVVMQDDALHLGQSGPGRFVRTSERGATVTRLFCRSCGATLTSYSDDSPYRGVRVGLLDDSSFFFPQVVLFSRRAPAWVRWPETAKLFDTQPE